MSIQANFKIIFLILLITGASHFSSLAQNLGDTYNKVSIASPSAASLAKYVDVPVSAHTGIPQISIPMYTLKEGPLEMPLSLSYHASGLKTMEPSGWVGAGWSLNAGGVITRTVRGGPDERGTIYNQQTHGHFSDYGYNNYLVDPVRYSDTDDTPGGYATLYNQYFVNGQRDPEPDLFFFNFNGYSGKFYFNDDRTPMLVPEQDIKIEYDYPNTSESIQGFMLTTPDGVKYHFGATPSTTDVDPVEFSRLMTLGNGIGFDKVISSWYLNKVESPDSKFSIALNYQPDIYSYHMLAFRKGIEGDRGYDVIKNFVRGVVLDNIVTSNGQVSFVLNNSPREDLSSTSIIDMADRPNTTSKALGQINIVDKNTGILNKSYKMLYDYFVDNVTPLTTEDMTGITSDKKRLKLLSLQEFNSAGTAIGLPYKFDYFQELVPRRLSFGQDHWGFINGIVNNTKVVSTFIKNGVAVPGAYREPVWPAMRGGTIRQITYPTGGTSGYDFEANEYYTSVYAQGGTRTTYEQVTVGFSGGEGQTISQEFPIFIDTKTHIFKLRNTAIGGKAVLNIRDANNVLLDRLEASLSQSLEITRNYTPGTYSFELIKESVTQGGNGAELTIYTLDGSVVSTNAIVGGLRIKQIIQKGFAGSPDIITSYDYNEPGSNLSSGVLYGKPAIVQIVRNDIWKDAQIGFNSPNGCLSSGNLSYLQSPTSIRPLGSSQGSHIGYQKVKTVQQDNGYTISIFDVSDRANDQHDDIAFRSVNLPEVNCTLSVPNYPEAPQPFSYTRGDLIYNAIYNVSNSLISDASYSSEYTANPITTPAFIIVPNINIPGGAPLYTKYNLSTARIAKRTVEKRQFVGSNLISTKQETLYQSPYHHQVTKIIDYTSKGETLETRYKYAADFRVSSQDNISDGYLNYLTAFNSCQNTFQNSVTQCTGDKLCLHRAFVLNDVCLSNARINFVNYRKANFTNSDNLSNARFQEAIFTADTKLRPILRLREQNNLALIETSKWKNNNLLSTVYNIYDHSPSVTDGIYLTKIQTVNLNVPSPSFTETSVINNNTSLTKDERYDDKFSYSYNQGRVVQSTPANALSDSYQWGYKNQYPIVSVQGAGTNEFYHENFEELNDFDEKLVLDTSRRHSGQSSGKIINAGTGEIVSHSSQWKEINLTKSRSFKYSGWIYSDGPSAQLHFFMRRPNETEYFSYVDDLFTGETGKWVFIEKEVKVPADVARVNMRVDNNGGGTVWFDDLKFHPADAQMTTYTFAPLIGMTSQTDPKGQTTYYEYDNFQRLKSIKDQNRNILKEFCYNYAGQQSECTTGSTPVPEPVVPCSPTSTLACSTIQVGLPFNLTFDQPLANSLLDKSNQGIGFTMAGAYSGTRLSVDGMASNSNVPGYEASQLTLGSGQLQILSNKGISYLSNNNQLNTLGVKFDSQNSYQVETDVINPFYGTSAQQGGIWIGQNDQTFLKLVAVGGRLEFRKELNDASGTEDVKVTDVIAGLDTKTVKLRVVVDPATNTAEAFYSIDGNPYVNVGLAYSVTGFSTTGMGLTGGTTFAGVFATHRLSSTPVTFMFDRFTISVVSSAPEPAPVACFPLSSLPCNAIQVSLPLNLTFDQAQASTIVDKAGQGTGFTMVDAYSGARLSVDGTPTNNDLPGHEASKLTLGSGRLQIVSNKGIAYLTNNNQLNTLGVKFDSQNKYQVETVLINPFNGTSAQQAGIWIGQNDKTFLKLVAVGNKLEFRKEVADVSASTDLLVTAVIAGLDAQTVRLRVVVDPATNLAEAFYSTDGTNYISVAGAGLGISGMGLTGSTAFAGIYATHRSSSTPVTYTFDNFSISNISSVNYLSVAQSSTFIKNNCATGGTGSSVTYTVVAGTYSSTISQADANSKAQNDVNSNGQTYANANGTCTFSNVVKSGIFTRNNCSVAGTGSAVTYSVAAGSYSSIISQADADSKAQNDVNANGQTYANTNGTCSFTSAAKSGIFTRNNCSVGGTGSAVTYAVAAGAYSSSISQADADSKAQNDVNANGQTYANANGTCTFSNVVKSGSFTKNNCATGGTGSAVTFTVAAGSYSSTISQADADAKAQNDVNVNGQTYANNNGTCTFLNVVKSGNFTKNDCPVNSFGTSVTYTVNAGSYTSVISQADADAKAQSDVNANGQAYANANGSCSPVISISLKCRISGSCNDNATCGVRYTVYYTNLDASKTYTSTAVKLSGTASVTLSGFVQSGSTAIAYLDYLEPNGSSAINFNLNLNVNGVTVGSQNFNISHSSSFAQISICQ